MVLILSGILGMDVDADAVIVLDFESETQQEQHLSVKHYLKYCFVTEIFLHVYAMHMLQMYMDEGDQTILSKELLAVNVIIQYFMASVEGKFIELPD